MHSNPVSYDELDRLIEIRLSDGSTVNYAYNPTDLVRIDRHGKTHSYLYDLAGRLIQEDTFDGAAIFYSYDDKGNLSSISAPYHIQTFVYDAAGNMVSSKLNGETTTYGYDGLYQLVEENTTNYSYDSLFNRLTKGNQEYQLNVLHQVLSDAEHTYSYDPNGNRLTKDGISYTYDALNRLISAGEIRYTYDPLGRLQTRTSPTSQESYLYYKDYDLGTRDNLKIMGKGIAALEQDGKLYSVVRDQRGSACVILADGIAAAIYSYNAFGETKHEGTIHSPWQYCGHRADIDTKLIHAPKRVYDPCIGRWLTPDPLGFADGPNLYAYVHNNPLIFIDPTGLWAASLFKTISGAVGRMVFNDKPIFFDHFEDRGTKSELVYSNNKHFKDFEVGGIGFINGINTSLLEFQNHLDYVGRLAGGVNIHGVYNASSSRGGRDVCEYFLNRMLVCTPPVRRLHDQWNKFFSSAGKDTPFLQNCHSQGAVHAGDQTLKLFFEF